MAEGTEEVDELRSRVEELESRAEVDEEEGDVMGDEKKGPESHEEWSDTIFAGRKAEVRSAGQQIEKLDREARDRKARWRASGLGFGRVVSMIVIGILLAHSILAVIAYVIFTVYSDVL